MLLSGNVLNLLYPDLNVFLVVLDGFRVKKPERLHIGDVWPTIDASPSCILKGQIRFEFKSEHIHNDATSE